MDPSSHCRTSIFEEGFRLQYVRGDIHIRIATKSIILTFCQSGTLPGKVNMEAPLTFGTETLFELLAWMHWKPIGSLKDESCTIGYVPQSN